MFDIVVNPAGASGRTLKKWKGIEHLFKEAGEEYHVFYSTVEHGITAIMKELTADSTARDIVIVGGDGTMNQAVNGICDLTNVRIGFISCGSGNDLARSLHLPSNEEKCARTILKKNNVRSINIGELVYLNHSNELYAEKPSADGLIHRRFAISSGIGFDAAICQKVQVTKMKKTLNRIHLGKLVYIEVAVGIIAHTPRVKAKISVDGAETEYSHLLTCVVMNEPYEGGGFKFCPHASDSDNLITSCIADDLSQFDFFRIFPSAYTGSHLKFRGISEVNGTKMEIKTERPLWVHTDGEVACMSSDVEMHLMKEKMTMLD